MSMFMFICYTTDSKSFFNPPPTAQNPLFSQRSRKTSPSPPPLLDCWLARLPFFLSLSLSRSLLPVVKSKVCGGIGKTMMPTPTLSLSLLRLHHDCRCFIRVRIRPTDQLLISADEGRREREEWREMVWLAGRPR